MAVLYVRRSRISYPKSRDARTVIQGVDWMEKGREESGSGRRGVCLGWLMVETV